MGTITSANSIFTLAQASLYPNGVTLQQFSADDMFDMEAIKNLEFQMGIDGVLAAGFVFVAIPQSVSLLAISPSIDVFDLIYTTQLSTVDALPLSATILLPSIGKQLTCSNGYLSSYKPLPPVKKTLQPQTFEITWNTVIPSVLSL